MASLAFMSQYLMATDRIQDRWALVGSDRTVVADRLRRARSRMGWSQRELAARWGKSESLVAKIEQGAKRLDSVEDACRLAELTGVDVVWLLGLDDREPGWQPRPLEASRPRPVDSRVSTAESATAREWDSMLCRMFVLDSLSPVMSANPAKDTGTRSDSATSLLDDRDRVAPEVVADLCTVAATYRKAYRFVPASKLLPLAHGHMELALSLRPAWQPAAERHALLSVAGEMAALAATSLGLDLGRYRDSEPYLDLALRAANATGSAELESVVLAGRSFHLANGYGQPKAALELATVACDVAAKDANPLTRAWVAAVCSEHFAALGDEKGCRRSLDVARAALDLGDDGSVPWQGIGAFDEAKLDAYEGGDLNRLGRYDEAAAVLDSVLVRLGPTLRRHRCTALIDRAEVRLSAGLVDGCCADAHEAIEIAAETQHAESLRRVERLARKALATRAESARKLWHRVLVVKAENSTILEGAM